LCRRQLQGTPTQASPTTYTLSPKAEAAEERPPSSTLEPGAEPAALLELPAGGQEEPPEVETDTDTEEDDDLAAAALAALAAKQQAEKEASLPTPPPVEPGSSLPPPVTTLLVTTSIAPIAPTEQAARRSALDLHPSGIDPRREALARALFVELCSSIDAIPAQGAAKESATLTQQEFRTALSQLSPGIDPPAVAKAFRQAGVPLDSAGMDVEAFLRWCQRLFGHQPDAVFEGAMRLLVCPASPDPSDEASTAGAAADGEVRIERALSRARSPSLRSLQGLPEGVARESRAVSILSTASLQEVQALSTGEVEELYTGISLEKGLPAAAEASPNQQRAAVEVEARVVMQARATAKEVVTRETAPPDEAQEEEKGGDMASESAAYDAVTEAMSNHRAVTTAMHEHKLAISEQYRDHHMAPAQNEQRQAGEKAADTLEPPEPVGGATIPDAAAPSAATAVVQKNAVVRESRGLSVSGLTVNELRHMGHLSEADIYELYEELYDERLAGGGGGERLPHPEVPASSNPRQRRAVVEEEARRLIAEAGKGMRVTPEVPTGGPGERESPPANAAAESFAAGHGRRETRGLSVGCLSVGEISEISLLPDEDIYDLYQELAQERPELPPAEACEAYQRRAAVGREAVSILEDSLRAVQAPPRESEATALIAEIERIRTELSAAQRRVMRGVDVAVNEALSVELEEQLTAATRASKVAKQQDSPSLQKRGPEPPSASLSRVGG